MSIRSKIISYLSFLFIIAIGNAIFALILENFSEEKLEWVIHTHEVINITESYLSSMQDTETGQRGYLLTKDTSYLEPYYNGLSNSKDYFEKLSDEVSDNPKQVLIMDSIKNSMKLKMDEMKKTVILMENNEFDEAISIVKDNKGKKYMDDIRNQINDFIHEELLLLEKRKADYRAIKVQISTILFIELLLFIFLAILSIQFFNRALFSPLKLLLSSTHKMEKGYKVDVSSITTNDEMGYLLSSFYKMNHTIAEQVENLDYKAHHDKLTGLLNRTSLYTKMTDCIKQSSSKTAILFIDLNKFKLLNDTLGHNAGDMVLVEVANRLKEATRTNDIVFRLGGDEFLVLLNDIPNRIAIEVIVSNIMGLFNKKLMILDSAIEISLSIGISISPDDGNKPEELLKKADIAMYESKNSKNYEYKFYDQSMLDR